MMNLTSKYFDRIRIKPCRDEVLQPRSCAQSGCVCQADYRAPKYRASAPQRPEDYHWFCLNHVRDYNRSFNYFDGMNDEQVADYIKANLTGHRPTWVLGAHPWTARAATNDEPEGDNGNPAWRDSFEVFGTDTNNQRRSGKDAPRHEPRNQERKSLRVLGLDETTAISAIKAHYKQLVKQNHPDLNAGDRGGEDRLKEIIQAYNYLKFSGYLG